MDVLSCLNLPSRGGFFLVDLYAITVDGFDLPTMVCVPSSNPWHFYGFILGGLSWVLASREDS